MRSFHSHVVVLKKYCAPKMTLPILLVSVLVCSEALSGSTSGFIGDRVSDEMLQSVPGKNWLSYRGNLANWGYSSLQQINKDNVENLSLAWTWPLPNGTNAITPLVFEGVMYLATPSGAIQALDAVSGDLIWEYQRSFPPDISTTIGTHVRSIAIYGDKIYTSTGDAHIVALYMDSGRVAWEFEIGDYRKFGHTTGPLVVQGKVFTGRRCEATLTTRCFLLANDAETGEELWRTHLVPGKGETGDESWKGVPVENRGHVGAWGPGAFDPELNLLYWGTSVPAPSNELVRGTAGGDVLFSNSTLALDPDTGEIVWYLQHLPRDNWDLDHAFERILVDSRVNPGKEPMLASNPSIDPADKRRLVTGIPGKTGIVWTLDRETGEFLWARETVYQNVISAVDPQTGKVTVNEASLPQTTTDAWGPVCPSHKGGRNWPPGAYSPKTNAIYMPLYHTCVNLKTISDEPTPGEQYGLLFDLVMAEGVDTLGELQAISVETGEILWKHQQRSVLMSVLSTDGSLVFSGDTDRRFRAFNATDGNVLWESILHGPVTGTPITYTGDGVQYIAVTAGGGDWISGDLHLLAELPPVAHANMLYVFALPQSPKPIERAIPATLDIDDSERVSPVFTANQVDAGKKVYIEHCQLCHGKDMAGTFAAAGLVGENFTEKWANRSAYQLVDYVQKRMPLHAPGSLTQSEVVDFLAYWYWLRGFEAGDEPLSTSQFDLRRTSIRVFSD